MSPHRQPGRGEPLVLRISRGAERRRVLGQAIRDREPRSARPHEDRGAGREVPGRCRGSPGLADEVAGFVDEGQGRAAHVAEHVREPLGLR